MSEVAPNGVLVVDKARGRSSAAVVDEVRSLSRARKAGHAGTLDPMATGVLAVCLGEGTKLATFLLADEKEYEADVLFGTATDSDDADGAVVETRGVAPAALDPEIMRAAVERFVGPQRQRPPRVSALKVDGRRAYARARDGEAFELIERDVVVHALAVVALEPAGWPDAPGPLLRLRVLASKGFYVRALARDLGPVLGTVAHLAGLRRTRSGPFGIDRAATVGELHRRVAAGEPLPLVSCTDAIADLAVARLDVAEAAAVRQGRSPSSAILRARLEGAPDAPDALVRLVDADGVLAAVARLAAAGAPALLQRVFFAEKGD